MINFRKREGAIDENSNTPIEDYLRSLGIERVEEFLKVPSKESEENPFLLENMERGLELAHEMMTSGNRILLVVDCDVDGYTSSAIFYNYFKSIYPAAEIEWILHEGKEHGIESGMMGFNHKYMVVPDAGSNQDKELSELSSRGTKILILDHHEVEKPQDITNVIRINNQTSRDFMNKALSGAGVVLKFIQAYDAKYGFSLSNKFYDLAALGIISDVMDCRNLDNNYIVYTGLHNIKNKMLQALLKKQEFKITNPTCPNKIDVGFYIAPIINGTIRFGEQQEKEVLFRGFIESPTSTEVQTVYRGTTRVEDFYDYAARIAANAKSRQDAEKKKCAEFLKEKIAVQGLDKNSIVCVITDYEKDRVQVPKTITGLVAMDLLKEYNKPCLVLHPRKNENGELVYAGSGRSKPFEGLGSFRQFVHDTTGSEYAQGHAYAFGAAVRANEFEDFIAECNEKLKNVDFSNDFVEVECVFAGDAMNRKLLCDFAENQDIYGNGIPQPLIALTGITPSNYVSLMKNNSLRLMIGGISCVRFKDEKLCSSLPQTPLLKYTIIGRIQMNYFMGNANPQIIIDNIDLEGIKTASLF